MANPEHTAYLLRRVKEQPYRSFKMRYLLYALPIMLIVSGLMTIVLAGFANMHLDHQYRQHIGRIVAEYTEELRMIILSRNIADLQDFLQKLAVKIDSVSVYLHDADGQMIASFAERKENIGDYSIEYKHRLLMQNLAGLASEWCVTARIKPNPLTSLIDSFILYQLLIIAVMLLGAITSTFLAFERSITRPLNLLKSFLMRSSEDGGESLDPVIDNDEFGEIGVLLHDLVQRRRLEEKNFIDFVSSAEIAFFEFDLKDEQMHFIGNIAETTGINNAIIRTLGDLWLLVSSDQRGEAKQIWYDIRELMPEQPLGHHRMELRLAAARDEYSSSGGENWVRLYFFWNRSEDLLVRGYLRNITTEKKREIEFLAQAERFRKTYEYLPIGIWRSQADRFVYMNQAMAEILGFSDPSEAIEKIQSISRDIYVSAVDRTFFLDELKKRDQVKNLEMRFRRSNGEVFWGAIFGRLYQDRNVQYVEGGFVDITMRKQAEERLRNDEDFLRQCLDTAGIVSWQFDSVSGQMHFRGPVVGLLGSSAEKIDSVKSFARVVHSDDLQKFIDSLDRGRRIDSIVHKDKNRVEFRICKVNSDLKTDIRWIQSVYGLSETSRSGVLRGVFVDITLLKESEEKLRQAMEKARLESHDKLQFFANMSHDIRTPLNAIIGFSELLSPILVAGKGEQYVSSILDASRNLIGVIDGILDLARLEAGRVELLLEPCRPVDIADDLRQSFAAEAERKQLNLSVTVDTDVPAVLMIDEARLRQILISLLGNAIKFTAHGSVTLKISLAHSPHRNLVNLLITVEDSGIGIPEDDLAEIFDPFSTKRGKGDRLGSAGISLAVCERLVSLMNGSIKAKSDFERGTRFEILIKDVGVFSGHQKVRSAAKLPGRDIHFCPQKVLVADDTASNRELLSEALRNAGLTVLCAVDGSEAVEMAKQHLPDIIFMDIRMPEKDGVCAARELKCIDSTAAIPIVAVTASVSFSEEEKLKGLFDGFLNKPISLARLFAEAARFLRHEVEEQETEKSENLLLPPEAFEQMNEPWQLCEIAEKDFLPVIAELEGAIVIGKVKALAERLKQVSSHHSFNHLLLEADRLMSKAGAFDISGMREICLRIRKILQQVISFYSRG